MSLQECINRIKEAHPDLYPIWYIEDQGVYLFNLLKRGVNKEEATVNFYAIDPKKGTLAGPVPPLNIYTNEELSEKINHPHMVASEDKQPLAISHHGIKGQKWGVRRFQDMDGTLTTEGRERYGIGNPPRQSSQLLTMNPVDIKTHNAKSIGSKNAGEKKPGFIERGRIKQAERAEQILEAMNRPSEGVIDRTESKKGGIDKGKIAEQALYTVINPLNVVNLAADGMASAVAKQKTNSYFKNRENKSELDPKTGLYMKKEGSYNDKQDLAAVNPGYMNMNTNTKNNCMLCTTTYDLRKRGYDVTAQLDSEGYTFPDLKKWYPSAKIEKNTRYDENGRALSQKEYVKKTVDNLLKQGDGARGNLMVWFTMGGGHSIVYEVQKGKVVIKDGQTGMTYSRPEAILNNTLTNSFARLDNVQPDLKKIKECCVR